MLKIKNVSAGSDTTQILNNINLEVKAGEIHAIMGPSASGKSALAHLIQGNPFVSVTDGTIQYQKKNITKLPAHKRSHLGIFTTFQDPVEIDGITNIELFRTLFRSRTGQEITSEVEEAYRDLLISLRLDTGFLQDFVNTTSGPNTDCKKGELLQMLILQPELVILDEIDDGLTEESIELVALMIKNYLEDKSRALIVITNNTKFLDQLTPDYVHILVEGQIREHGTTELYKRIIEDGHPQLS